MKKILVIEDDQKVQESISDLLEMKNYEIFLASNGRDGIMAAMDRKPDLIICDIMMASMNGFSVLHTVRSYPELANTPFIFLSALAEQKYVALGMEKGADHYLVKPFRAEDLFAAVEKLTQ